MSEEQNNSQEQLAPQEETTETEAEVQDIVPVEWEVVRETFELRQEQLRAQEYVARFLLDTERQKADLLARLDMMENNVYESAAALREVVGVDPSIAYELKLPEVPEEKAHFIRKQ